MQNDPGLCELTEVALQSFLATKHINVNRNTLSNDQLQELQNREIPGKKAKSVVCQYVDFLLTTWNPCSPEDG